MADVVKIARDRVTALEAETGRLRDFIRMAEKLMKDGTLGGTTTPNGDVRRTEEAGNSGPAASGSAAAAKNGVDEDDSDLTLGDRAAETPAPHTFAKQVESALERKNLFRRPSP